MRQVIIWRGDEAVRTREKIWRRSSGGMSRRLVLGSLLSIAVDHWVNGVDG